jgi:hypothetical protein
MNGHYGYMWWGVHRANAEDDLAAIGNHEM